MSATLASTDRDEVWIKPLSREVISTLPYPKLAQALGGVVVVETQVCPVQLARLKKAWSTLVKKHE